MYLVKETDLLRIKSAALTPDPQLEYERSIDAVNRLYDQHAVKELDNIANTISDCLAAGCKPKKFRVNPNHYIDHKHKLINADEIPSSLRSHRMLMYALQSRMHIWLSLCANKDPKVVKLVRWYVDNLQPVTWEGYSSRATYIPDHVTKMASGLKCSPVEAIANITLVHCPITGGLWMDSKDYFSISNKVGEDIPAVDFPGANCVGKVATIKLAVL